MSGHSKWASIKHKKGALDAKRGKLFSRIVKELTSVARKGGGNVEQNARLRLLVQKARENNMPANNIERAIKKGTGELPGVQVEEVTYEGYGAAGVAILVETLTDNKNRTTGEVRNAFDKNGGKMAGQGAVAWQFEKKGFFIVQKANAKEEKLMELVIDAGAQDLKTEGESYEITTEPSGFESVKQALEGANITVESQEVTMLPQNTVKASGSDAKHVLALIETLEDLEDVQHVYANFDISEADMQQAD